MIVVGSSNMDIVLRVARAPGAGETVVGSGYAMYPGGKGANQAVAAQRAGASVCFVACLGCDAYGEILYDSLNREGLDLSPIVHSAMPTGLAFILLEENGQNRITVISGANAALMSENVLPAIQQRDILLMQLEVPLEVVTASAQQMHKMGGVVILNASPLQQEMEEILSLADILLVNEIEAMQLLALSEPVNAQNAIAMVEQLASGRQSAVITLGKAGVAWATRQGKSGLVPGFSVEVVDTTGCGDAFAGAFSAAIASDHSMESAVIFANAAGALAATREGAQASLPLRATIESFIAQNTSTNSNNYLRA